MAQFTITVPQHGIDSSTPSALAGENFTADRGISRTVKHRVLTAKFGDGYEQRVKNGINIKNDNFNLSFKNRASTEINKIAAFLDNYAGKNFVLTITDYAGDTAMKVVCEDYTITYLQPTIHTLTCKVRRVYEP